MKSIEKKEYLLLVFFIVANLTFETFGFKTQSLPLNRRESLENYLQELTNNRTNSQNFANNSRFARVGFDAEEGDRIREKLVVIRNVGEEDPDEYDFRYELPLNPEEDLRLFWDIFPAEERIVFRLKGNINRSSFLGFGFSSYGEVENADFVVMWTGSDGRHRIQVNLFLFYIYL